MGLFGRKSKKKEVKSEIKEDALDNIAEDLYALAVAKVGSISDWQAKNEQFILLIQAQSNALAITLKKILEETNLNKSDLLKGTFDLLRVTLYKHTEDVPPYNGKSK